MASTQKIQSLTGIRGVAAIWVVVFHFSPMASEFLSVPAPTIIIPYGYLGVDLFFLLSGYVLGLVYEKPLLAAPSATLVRFWIGRVFRILPLHWFVLLILGALVVAWPAQLDTPRNTLANFIASFFLVQNWGLGSPWSWNWPTWSLSAEMAAYVVFPVMLFAAIRFVPRWRGANIAAACLCLLALIAILLAFNKPNIGVTGLLGLPRCILEFAAGYLLCRAVRAGEVAGVSPDYLLIAGVAVIAGAISVSGGDFVAPFGFALIILACAASGRLANSLFANRIAVFLGDISYSLYLTHSVILVTIEAVIRSYGLHDMVTPLKLALLLGCFVAIVVISTLTWRWIEIPGQRLGAQVQARLTPARRAVA